VVDSSGAMRVLLVEDEEDLGQAIKQVLIGEKYVVDWITDGAQAWYCLENQWADYTVAIFDWLLPELSGLELCQRLRSQLTKIRQAIQNRIGLHRMDVYAEYCFAIIGSFPCKSSSTYLLIWSKT
jgi:DNA-binding NtrC family response regulator